MGNLLHWVHGQCKSAQFSLGLCTLLIQKILKSGYKELGVNKSSSLFIPELFEGYSASTEIV